MTGLSDLLDAALAPECKKAVQLVVQREREAEVAFRWQLVADFNHARKARGALADAAVLEQQRRFITLSLPAAEASDLAREYAHVSGRTLPPVPPSVALEDI